jgi:hypothetical protein
MIKLYTAFTSEIDNPEAAVAEVLEQLKPDKAMLKNSVGIIHFYYEFTETGVYQALAEALPFDVVGCASASIGVSGKYGDLALSVTLITSDDVDIRVDTYKNANGKSRDAMSGELTALFADISAKERPKLVLSFMPMMQHFSGDDLIASSDALSEPLLLFGTIAMIIKDERSTNIVVSNDVISNDILVFVSFYGEFEPKFTVVTSLGEGGDSETFGRAIVTESEGAVLKAVNGISAVDFLVKQGIITEDRKYDTDAVSAVPALLTRKDGTRVVRAFLGAVDETDYIFSAGNIENGAEISFFCLNGEKTIKSAEHAMNDILASKERSFIAFSCAGRAWSLGSNYLNELRKISEIYEAAKKTNAAGEYCVSYSAGEICPAVNRNGEFVNTLHNYTMIFCSFA